MPYIKCDNIAMVLLEKLKTFVLLVYLRQQKYKSGYRVFYLKFYTLHLHCQFKTKFTIRLRQQISVITILLISW